MPCTNYDRHDLRTNVFFCSSKFCVHKGPRMEPALKNRHFKAKYHHGGKDFKEDINAGDVKNQEARNLKLDLSLEGNIGEAFCERNGRNKKNLTARRQIILG